MDKKVISCAFNIDTACVEIKYTDGSMISIDCTLVDAEVPGICLRVVSWSGWFHACGYLRNLLYLII